jgi:hypothetical protein
MEPILAGNIVRSVRTFTGLGGGNVNPSAVVVTVTDPDGTGSTLEDPQVTYSADNTSLTVTVDWVIADGAAQGWWTITHDVSGSMVAAYQESVAVLARIEA